MHITLENPVIRIELESGKKAVVIPGPTSSIFHFQFEDENIASLTSLEVEELAQVLNLLGPNNDISSLAAVSETGETIIDMDDIDILFT